MKTQYKGVSLADSLWKATKCAAENLGDTVQKISLEGNAESYWKYGRAHEMFMLIACTALFPNSVKDLVEPCLKLLYKQLVLTKMHPEEFIEEVRQLAIEKNCLS